MKVLVTGATGYIGSQVVDKLLQNNHIILGVTTSRRGKLALAEKGVYGIIGDIKEPESIASYLEQVDGVIHTAFNHKFARYLESCKEDGNLLNFLASRLIGTNKPLVAASATTVVASGLSRENATADDFIPRSATEQFLSHAKDGLNASVVRLPPSVHGKGDRAFIPALIAIAKDRGFSAYIENSDTHWSAVHSKDAAQLFCDVLQRGESGARYHGVHDENVPFIDIAKLIAEQLDIPIKAISKDQAEAHFGWLSMFVLSDMAASNQFTEETLGWQPKGLNLLDSLKLPANAYF